MIGSNPSPGDLAASPLAEPSPVEPSPALPPGGESPPAVAPTVAAAPPKLGRFRRFIEWFWRGRAMAALRAEGRIGPPRAVELLRRAWVALELAERALRPVPRLLAGNGDGPARELAREAVYFGLVAAREIAHFRGAPGEPPASPVPAGSFTDVWSGAERALLVEGAGSEGALVALEHVLELQGFAEFAELAPEEQARQARDLVAFARTLVTRVEAPRVRLDRLITQRLVRVTAAFAAMIGLAVGGLAARSWSEHQRDLALGRPYKTSSQYPTVGCHSPDQDCPESPFFFFHTNEEDHAWVEIDLGGKKRIAAFKLVNREDCCADRAAPLAVEVSTDHKTWREIARRTDTFSTWSKEVNPVNAHYVRVISLRKTVLHLKRFSVFR